MAPNSDWPPHRVECKVLAALADVMVVKVKSPDGTKTFEGALLSVQKQ